MNLKDIHLEPRDEKLVLYWLVFAVSTLVFAGIFAFLLAMARTPGIQELLPGKDYLPVALVGHVDLSVVIWFLAFMGVLWVLTTSLSGTGLKFPPAFVLGWSGFWVSALGTVLLIIAALFALGEPIFSNYIPVLTHPLFYLSLLLVGGGIAMTVAGSFTALRFERRYGGSSAVTFGMTTAGIAVLIALICFGIALILTPGWFGSGIYFERLFWGGGHILQFANTIGMVTAWLMLSYIAFGTAWIPERLAKMAYAYYLFFIIPAPLIFFFIDITTQAYKDSFTHLMQYGLGPSTALIILYLIKGFNTQRKGKGLPWSDPTFSSLILSMFLFIVGGVMALFIRGSNVKIPAHYHGVIGAVTVAFMGLTYHLIPLLGKEIRSIKTAKYQPYLYGIGQILFALGMFWAGSHGVPRKTYGTAQNLDSFAKTAGMALTGIGGLIAIIGGAAFVLNVLASLLGKKESIKQETI